MSRRAFLCVYGKINAKQPNAPVVPQHRSFRRFVKKRFASFIKRQAGSDDDGFEKEIKQRLKDLEEKFEFVARIAGVSGDKRQRLMFHCLWAFRVSGHRKGRSPNRRLNATGRPKPEQSGHIPTDLRFVR